jgi:hypothetical protein
LGNGYIETDLELLSSVIAKITKILWHFLIVTIEIAGKLTTPSNLTVINQLTVQGLIAYF